MNNLKDFNFNHTNVCDCENKSQYEQQAKDMISKYKDMNNQQLASELISEVARQKANGTFDKSKLIAMLDSIKGMLKYESQYIQLRQVIENL